MPGESLHSREGAQERRSSSTASNIRISSRSRVSSFHRSSSSSFFSFNNETPKQGTRYHTLQDTTTNSQKMSTLRNFRSIARGTDLPTGTTDIIIRKPDPVSETSHIPASTTRSTTTSTETATPRDDRPMTPRTPAPPPSRPTTTTVETTTRESNTTTSTSATTTSKATTSTATTSTATTKISTTSSATTPESTTHWNKTQGVTFPSSTTLSNVTKGDAVPSMLAPSTTLYIILGILSIAVVVLVALSLYFGLYRKKKWMTKATSNNNILLESPVMAAHTSTFDPSDAEQGLPDITNPEVADPDDYEHITDYEEYHEPCSMGIYAEIGDSPVDYEPMVTSGLDRHVYARTESEQYEEPVDSKMSDSTNALEVDTEPPHYDRLDLDRPNSDYQAGDAVYELADDTDIADYQLADEDGEVKTGDVICCSNNTYNVLENNIQHSL